MSSILSKNDNICSICQKSFKTKYTLSNHIRCVHKKTDDLTEETDLTEFKCESKFCKYSTMYKKEISKHIKKCNFIFAEQYFREEFSKLKTEHANEISKLKNELIQSELLHEKQLSELKIKTEILQQELEKAQRMIQSLSETAINRPTTTNDIGNLNHVKITNHLSDHKSYLRQIHPERVTELLHLHFEKYFMDGQSGLARFVVEHIIRLEDGKMILCCTDPTRKRFRFIDADGKLAEDLRAKMFRSKIKIPVKEMCNEVFDRIIERIKHEKKVKISSGESEAGIEIDFLDKKIDMAERRFFEIRAFDGDDGTEFLNELTLLLRNSQDAQDLYEKE